MAMQEKLSGASGVEFLYSTAPLELSDSEIRLVELQRNELSDTPTCVLQTYPVKGPYPPYTALSYAWGPNVRHNDVILNGRPFPVGRNLWHFLHQMTCSARFGAYWIDAICIDQSNMRERNHQVQLMRQIYTNARFVLAWLGEEDSMTRSNVAMDYLTRREPLQAVSANFGRFWTPRQAKAVLALCERPYWTRIWIVQELLLARDITIHCGSKVIPWYDLVRFFEVLAVVVKLGRDQHIRVSPVLASAAAKIVKAKSEWADQRSQSLTTLVKMCRDQQASDVRDKIYALHGLACDTNDMDVNYSITGGQLLVVVLRRLCAALESSASVRESRRDLLRNGQLLSDILRQHYDEEQLETVINIRENWLRTEEERQLAEEARMKAEEDRRRDEAAKEEQNAEIARQAEEARHKQVMRIKSVMWYLEGYEGMSEPQSHCYFRFLHCPYKTLDAQDWRAHCLDHFLLKQPPQRVVCIFCHVSSSTKELQEPNEWDTGIWACKHPWRENPKHNGWMTWRLYMTHIQEHHSTSWHRDWWLNRGFYNKLHSMGIIDEHELEQLKQDRVLHQPPAEYIRVAEGREYVGRDGRRDARSDLHPKRRKIAQRLMDIAECDGDSRTHRVLRDSLEGYCDDQGVAIGTAGRVISKAHNARHKVMSKARIERPWSTSASGHLRFSDHRMNEPGEGEKNEGQKGTKK